MRLQGEKGIIGLLEEPESACSKNLAESTATDECARPCQNSRIHCGVTRLSSSNSSGVSSHACVSYLDALLAAPARAPAALTAARRVAPFSAVVGLGMHDGGSSLHDACSNSWSDTVREKGPRAQGGSKVGVPARPKICVLSQRWRQGVNVRLAGGVRFRQVRCLLTTKLHAMMRLHCMIVPCVLVIQVVLVASCLCRGPPATAWIIRGRTRVGFRVPREGGAPKVGFPDQPKICALSQRWRQG